MRTTEPNASPQKRGKSNLVMYRFEELDFRSNASKRAYGVRPVD